MRGQLQGTSTGTGSGGLGKQDVEAGPALQAESRGTTRGQWPRGRDTGSAISCGTGSGAGVAVGGSCSPGQGAVRAGTSPPGLCLAPPTPHRLCVRVPAAPSDHVAPLFPARRAPHLSTETDGADSEATNTRHSLVTLFTSVSRFIGRTTTRPPAPGVRTALACPGGGTRGWGETFADAPAVGGPESFP